MLLYSELMHCEMRFPATYEYEGCKGREREMERETHTEVREEEVMDWRRIVGVYCV